MKLNVEELAREAGFGSGEFGAVWVCKTSALEAFTRLIVERCAVECEDIELPPGIDLTGAMPSSAWEYGTMHAATAIRNLLEDK